MSDTNLECGCCTGIAPETPAATANPPGQAMLAARVGTQPQFVASMRAVLSWADALSRLTVRSEDDPSLALIDAWATALDVLAFYDERIANEAYLETATERESLLLLARTIGYELGPGIAASTHLAFTMEEAPGAPEVVRLDAGIKVQSVPGQDEKPQVFETVEALEARKAWSAMKVKDTEPALPHRGMTRLYLKGTHNHLKAGDALLVVGKERRNDPANDNWDLRFVDRVILHPPKQASADPQAGYTEIVLDHALGGIRSNPALDEAQVYAQRTRAAVFGHNAPDWKILPDPLRKSYLGGHTDPSTVKEWPRFVVSSPRFGAADPDDRPDNTLDLDNAYPSIVPGSWMVLAAPNYRELYQVGDVKELSRAEYAVSGKVTRVKLTGENWDKFKDKVRGTVVHAQGELLAFAERPRSAPLAEDLVELAAVVPDLPAGRRLLVAGKDWRTGEARREFAFVKAFEAAGGSASIRLSAPLEYRYEPSSVTINANVAEATQGDTKADEHVGSGDAGRGFQRFALKQKPLTYVSAANATGAESTLIVRVDGVQWREVASLLGETAERKIFVTRRDDEGRVTLQFGDGRTGARLPTGVENVRATYRVGTGVAGALPAGRISTLLTRPLGLRDATNPFPAAGGQDPETRDQARRKAPLTVLTLDRIVSLTDFEDFAAGFSGIGKAQAIWLWNGERRTVHVTVAGVDGEAIELDSTLYLKLRLAMDDARSPEQSVRIDPFVPRTFDVQAKLFVSPDRIPEEVKRKVIDALLAAFSFDARAFSQGVSGSEVLAVAQKVPGVQWIDLDRLAPHGQSGSGGTLDSGPNAQVLASPARWENGRIAAAELLLIDSRGIDIVAATA